MRFRLVDLLWIMSLSCCLAAWHSDRTKQAKELDRSIELMRIYKHACVSNDAMYRREAAEMDRQHRALRAMADELERRLEGAGKQGTVK